ncbi:MAG TPA: FAD-dependent oxidoreductase [Anaerolineae bacterium]|nr:FAD-dependent oxidoreductase [Anaerolineae bacterium]HQI83195.1 FAD-dependent oxidoreductase [Anaerolineae bacterium]
MPKTIVEPQRELPIIAAADVIVVGGGPGGLPAAIAAARRGMHVLLIERYGFLGGLATAGLVAPILGHTASNSHTPIVEGLLKEMTERMHVLGGAPTWDAACQEWGVRFDAEAFKVVADRMVREANVELLLHTFATDVVVEGGVIQAVIVESKSGRQAVVGKVFIDATGDADVAFRAGAPTVQGRAFDGQGESMGSFIHIGGVAHVTEAQKAAARENLLAAMAQGCFRFYTNGFTGTNDMHLTHFSPNMTRWPGDSTNARVLTEAELGVREQVWKLWEFLKTQPGFEDCYIQATSPQVGPRESRQVIGDYVLTGDDVLNAARFPDAVARGSWYIDIHCPLGHTYPVHMCIIECPRGEACPYWAAEHDRTMHSIDALHPPDGDWYDIPYRCLTPQKIDNLLISGRCISATHDGMAGARVMGTCMAIGEAAGTAAALAVRDGVNPRDVDVAALRRALQDAGALV